LVDLKRKNWLEKKKKGAHTFQWGLERRMFTNAKRKGRVDYFNSGGELWASGGKKRIGQDGAMLPWGHLSGHGVQKRLWAV